MATTFRQLDRQLQELQKLQPVLAGMKPNPAKPKPQTSKPANPDDK
jgi:hypothetical protein